MQNPSKIHIRSQSYRTSTNNLTGSSGAGLYDLLIGTRVSSLKSLFITCAPSNAIEGKFAGVNPNLTQGTCLVLGANHTHKERLTHHTIQVVLSCSYKRASVR